MKNILLIGDSILVGSNQTSGYGTIVRDMLKDKANDCLPVYDSLGDQSYFAHIDIFRLNHKMYCNQ